MSMNYDDGREVTYEIVEEIGIISSSLTGWTKELNIVAWNGGQGKYDIREWSPQHDRMSKGITLNEQEMRTIVNLLRRRIRYVPRGVNNMQGFRDEMPHATAEEQYPEPSYEQSAVAEEQYSESSFGESTPAESQAGIPEPSDDEGWGQLENEKDLLDAEEPTMDLDDIAS